VVGVVEGVGGAVVYMSEGAVQGVYDLVGEGEMESHFFFGGVGYHFAILFHFVDIEVVVG
jgi:hypothetical protein